MNSYKYVKLISAALFISFIVGIYFFIAVFSKDKFERSFNVNMATTQKFVKKSVASFIESKRQHYVAISKTIFQDEKLLKALEQKNRAQFNNIIQNYYTRLKKINKNLWGMHVILPDNLSFIRVHKPHVADRYIPKGKKPLIDKVNANKQAVSGFEVGKFGYFFRINIPIFSKSNKYLGVAEFSVNLGDFTDMVKKKFGYECAFLIQKQEKKKFFDDLKPAFNELLIYKPTSNQFELALMEKIKYNLVYKINGNFLKMFFIKLNKMSTFAISFDITKIMHDKLEYEKDSLNFMIVFVLTSSIIWLFATIMLIKLLKFRGKATKELENKNKELDKKVKEKTKEINSLLSTFDANVIASRTNLKGIITYASAAYQKISGYTKAELIGKSHNIARHPDMPKEIFKQMWSAIKNDEMWVGEIKNLAKDGSSYWLKATIEPFYEDGIKKGYSAVREDITAKKELENLNKTLELKVQERTQEISDLLYFDNLTKLGSYHLLSKDINENDFLFTTLMLVNIDNFQNINGLYGFEAGNHVLKDFALCLKQFNIDDKYKLYRIYADEFVLFRNCDSTSIDEYYEDLIILKDAIQNYKFYIDEIGEIIKIDATVGISLGQENPINTVDMALRYAKKHKLNFKAYNTTLDLKDQLQDTVIWKEKIKLALEEDRIIPVFQPIVNKEQEIIKYEVLVRMQKNIGDTTNLISPNMFLEEAINSKQYNSIAKIVFGKTFDVMKNSDKFFSINISYDDIYNFTLINFIEENILKTPEIGNRLVIEILEDKAIGSDEIMKEFIAKFKKYGVKIAIDDFGTGHSNLSHVLDVIPDFLKIDGAFIKNINDDKKSYAMVKSIVEFCKELDIKVIAEYVHSKEVFDTLHQLGIDEYQGYYFSEPKVDI